MQVTYHNVARVFASGGDTHYIMPYGQRAYSWGKEERETLWSDIQAIYDEYNQDSPPEHFLGSLVVVSGVNAHGLIPVYTLFDGQQRLTTISLVFCALRDAINTSHPELARRLTRMLTNIDVSDDIHLKILPTIKNGDRDVYRALITSQASPNTNTSSLVMAAYKYFFDEISDGLKEETLSPEQLLIVIGTCFQVVLMNLDQNERPHRIFESLNAKGKPLTQADLIRNYIAMTLPTTKQEAVFRNVWEPIEERLNDQRNVARIGELSAFIRHYLAMQTGTLCAEGHIYARFRDWMINKKEDFEIELNTLKRFALYYDTFLRPENEKDPAIRARLESLSILEVSTAYPFLLAVFDARESGSIDQSGILSILETLENYLVRRFLAIEQSGYTNRMFSALWKELLKEASVKQVSLVLSAKLANKNCPHDREVKEAVSKRRKFRGSVTTRAKLQLVLERIDQYLTTGMDIITELKSKATIEHIMPQSLSEEWRTDLGSEAEQIQQIYGDTLGNLTLVTQAWNNMLSNKPFSEKKILLEQHGLQINRQYFQDEIKIWDDAAILHRANYLSEIILKIWPSLGARVATVSQRANRVRPLFVIFKEERIPVRSWRQTMKILLEKSIDAEKISQVRLKIPNIIKDDQTQLERPDLHSQLSNGWSFYHNLSSESAKQYISQIMAVLSISDEDWSVEEEII